jgi:CO/xanthine dehydrogenase Mo-binding subunit
MNATLSRRAFLEVSALVGGGLLLGCQIGGASGKRAATAGAPARFAPNAWVSIGSDGAITLVCHRNEMGQDVHTSLAMLVAEELNVDPRRVRVVQAPVDPEHYTNALLGAQITGGSTAVRDAWEPLRRAGATARTMLVAAAAAQWGVPAEECALGDGEVVHAKGKLSYAALAEAAAKQPVPPDVTLKSVASFRVIGQPLERLDGSDKARGKTIFGIDVALPGMLHAALAQCPVIGGRVASFDAGAAMQRPGVRQVVDIGEGVAVVAERWFTAREALADLKITWDEGPGAALDDAAIAKALDAAKDRPGALVKQAGDARAALAKGKPLAARYTTQLLAHVTLEPQNCVARVAADGVDVWASTQFPQGARDVAAQAAGVDPARVRIHAQFIGGGFGRRLDVDYVEQAVKIAKALPGTPVKLIWTREDDLTHDFYRPPSLHLLRGSVGGGRIRAFTHTLISPSITARMFPAFVKDGIEPFMTEGIVDFTYDIPDLDLRSVIQEVGLRVGYWRSVSHAQNAFAIECFVDELAHAAGADPVAFRLAMLQKLPRQAAVLERAAKEAGFRAKASGGRAFGVASMQCYETHAALVAEISGKADALRLERLHLAVDCGVAVHPDQVIAQLEGGAVTGLIQTLRSKVTLKNGRVQQQNFDGFQIPRMTDVPPITISLVESGEKPGGIGEVGVPLVAPAIANAVFALTGKRIRSLPLEDGGVKFASLA